MKVTIAGHGYVGKGMARMMERAHDVRIYDIATHPDPSALRGADLVIVCVPTPQGPNGRADISSVEQVVSLCDDNALVLIKSTVPPGTTRHVSSLYGVRAHFSPEYMGEPRNVILPWRHPDPLSPEMHDWVIVGGPHASEVLDYFTPIMSSDTRFVACDCEEAELAKYMENAYFATKIAFCNEFAKIAELHGVDYKKLRELWLLDPRMEGDHTMVFPERGFGGKCLPKDLAAIVAASASAGFEPVLLRAVGLSNKVVRGEA